MEVSQETVLKPRRSIHPKNHLEGHKYNKKIESQKNCCKCGKDIYTEDSFEDEELKRHSANSSEIQDTNGPDLCTIKNLTCEDCGKHERNFEWTLQNLLTTFNVLALVLLITIAIAISYKYLYCTSQKEFDVNIHNQTQEEINFDNELYGLEDIYKQQEERVWFTFAAGIKSVVSEKPYKPSTFLLLYDNDHTENTIKCLAQDVSKAASKYLMKQEIKPLIFAGKELNHKSYLDDPGLLLVSLEDPVKSHGAMIITSLQDIDPKVAAHFHFFCDRYSPLVEKAIFVFSLKVKSMSNSPLQKVAEDALLSLWSNDLPEERLHALITRMTGNVLKIFKDYSECSQ